MSTTKVPPLWAVEERLGERGAASGRAVAAVDEGDAVEDRGPADRRHPRGLVDHPDLDRVSAEGVDRAGPSVGVDEGVGAGSGGLVQPVDQERDRAVGAVAVVLDLVEARDVGIHCEHRGHGLRPLALELDGAGGAAAVRLRCRRFSKLPRLDQRNSPG
jgi:hypothetical protein